MWQKLNQSGAFSQNKVYTKDVNHIIEYINTIIQKTTTYTSAYINTMLLLFKVAPLTLYRCSYSGLEYYDNLIIVLCLPNIIITYVNHCNS
jgi:hypothetical protein